MTNTKHLFLILALLIGSMSLFATEGALIGKFTINAQGDQIVFSQGNLQYQASTQTWRFAPQQFNYVSKADNDSVSGTFSGWIDLFGWGTGLQPTQTDAVLSSFVDWGSNAISNGGNQPNLWRTLTIDEWDFIINQRPKAFQLRGQASVGGYLCYVLLPDNWTGGRIGRYYDYERPVYTAAEWADLEAAGAVCIPASGWRAGTTQWGQTGFFYYWSSTEKDAGSACDVEIKRLRDSGYDNEYYIYENTEHSFDKSYGLSVRLVQDVEPDPIEIEYAEAKPLRGRFTINADGEQIVFSQGDLQYFPQLDTFQFAANQWERSADNDYRTKYTKAWIDIFSWGMENDFILQTAASSTGADYVDFGTRAIANGGGQPNQWRTLSFAEWQYLLEGRPNAAQKAASATVNGVVGYMLLPDTFHMPKGLKFMPGWRHSSYDPYDLNTYSLEDWQRMEEAGAVFLPNGHLWTSTPQNMSGSADENHAYVLSMDNYNFYFGQETHLCILSAAQVRLVQAPTLPEPEVAPVTYNSEKPLTGKFLVGEDKVVIFSQGNLQYNDYVQTWQFAENQWDYLSKEHNISISEGYAEWFDLFGWGTGNHPTLDDWDYNRYPDFTDWGINPIRNGGNEPNQWFTLSKEEWEYLFEYQSHAAAIVHGIKGRIVLPKVMAVYPDYLNCSTMNENDNVLTDEQWAEMEANGAVFLPAALLRYRDQEAARDQIVYNNQPLRFWTSTPYTDEYVQTSEYAWTVYIQQGYNRWYYTSNMSRECGLPVRLVQETTNTIYLELAIFDARDIYDNLLILAEEKNKPGIADLAAYLLHAIESAEAVANDPDATQEEINQAKEDLENYINRLDVAVSVLDFYYELMKYELTEIAETYKAAIDPAIAIYLSEDATEEDLANAYQAMSDAYDAAIYAVEHWDVENVSAGEKPQKLLRDHMLLILRGDRTYTVTGQVIE